MAKQTTKKTDTKTVEKKATKKAIKPVKKSNLVDCLVVSPFFCTEKNKAFKKGDSYSATLERIEMINNYIYKGKKLNALQIVKSE